MYTVYSIHVYAVRITMIFTNLCGPPLCGLVAVVAVWPNLCVWRA